MAVTTETISNDELTKLVANLNQAAATYDPSQSAQGVGSRMSILQTAKEIMMALVGPAELLGMHSSNMMEHVALRTLIHLKVFNHFPEQGSVSTAELADRTGAQEALLTRLLRLPVTSGFVQQLPDLTYAHTKFSRGYVQDPGPGLVYQLMYDEAFLPLSQFYKYLSEKGFKEPEDQRCSPLTWSEGKEGMTVWELQASDPERSAAFQRGLPFLDAGIPIVGFYNFGELVSGTDRSRPVLVDIGGGQGQSIKQIMKAHPNIPAEGFVLQDLPDIIKLAEADHDLPSAVVKMAHDFTTEQPVKGAKAYYFRRVLHDYPDKICVEMLKQVVPAMAPDSVVLVSDFVVPERMTPADVPVATMSVLICNMGGKERTESDFRELFRQAGLEVTRVCLSDFGSVGLVEGRLSR